MDLAPYLAALLAPLGPDLELADGVRLVSTSSELGLRCTLEVRGRRVHVELTPREETPRFAAVTARFAVGYRSAPGDPDAVAPEEGVRLCVLVAERVAGNEARVLEALAEDARRARESEHGGARVREVRGGPLLVRAGTQAEPFLSLSPYVGCTIGCRFCYAQTRLASVRRLVALPDVPWGSYVDARVDAPELLAKELESAERLPIKLCPIVSDPYQALEARLGVTGRCLEVLGAAAWPEPVLVLTRSALVRRDAAKLAALPRAYVGVSLPTADDEVRAHFEPRGATVDERLETLRALRAAGVRTFAVVQPLLPGDVVALADALASSCGSVSVDVLRGTYAAERDFADPRYAAATDDGWQRDRHAALLALLAERGIPVWAGELPPA